ncbi:hypothetical protein [Isoptericola sp. AK164]|uniref:hypothetical protein n=1 Tax=Isoptericola sp. AK164 TaxID=3024246 RepID=UPI0024184A6D|nr:hypothetical protein [Isoptericola sp. AK164]
MSGFTTVVDRLAELAGKIPHEVAVHHLVDQPEVEERGLAHAYRLAETLGWSVREEKTSRGRAARMLRDPDRGRLAVFHASGAVALKTSVGPFDELFDGDPGDDELATHARKHLERLGVTELVADGESLELERLWRIRAAGSDPDGAVSEPVLCRAVGAFRHTVGDLPVLGRASAHVELTGKGSVSAASTLLRSPAGHSRPLATVAARDPYDAAEEVAHRLAKLLGSRDLGDEITPRGFSFGYLSLGRRRPQSVLAPFFVADVTIGSGPGRTKSAHLLPVAGSDERFLSLPRGAAPSTLARKPGAPAVA